MRNGFTTVELLVAIVIASIVTTLGFTIYGQVTENFSRQSTNARKLSEVLLAKKRMDGYCSRILSVHRCSKNAFTVKTDEDEPMITVRKSGNVLMAGTDTLVKHVDSFSCEVAEGKKHDAENAVLCWEAVIGGEWVCGAVEVRKE